MPIKPPGKYSFYKDDEFEAYINWYWEHFMKLIRNGGALGLEIAKDVCRRVSKYYFSKSNKAKDKFLSSRYEYLGKLFWKWYNQMNRGQSPEPYKKPNFRRKKK